MRALVIAPLVLAVLSGSTQGDDVKDRQPLQGTWKIVSTKSKGKEGELNLLLVIKGDGMTLKQPEDMQQKEQFRIIVDPSVSPAAIDIHKSDDNGKRAEKLFEGVYEVKGDDLRICFTAQQGPPWNRPSSIQPGDDTNEVLVVLRRQ
jgi:uncharacterized protein (TIGR03067 family)